MHAPEKDAKAARYYAYSLQQQRWQCHYNYFNYEPRPKTLVHVPRNACGSTGSLMSEKGIVLKNLNRQRRQPARPTPGLLQVKSLYSGRPNGILSLRSDWLATSGKPFSGVRNRSKSDSGRRLVSLRISGNGDRIRPFFSRIPQRQRTRPRTARVFGGFDVLRQNPPVFSAEFLNVNVPFTSHRGLQGAT